MVKGLSCETTSSDPGLDCSNLFYLKTRLTKQAFLLLRNFFMFHTKAITHNFCNISSGIVEHYPLPNHYGCHAIPESVFNIIVKGLQNIELGVTLQLLKTYKFCI